MKHSIKLIDGIQDGLVLLFNAGDRLPDKIWEPHDDTYSIYDLYQPAMKFDVEGCFLYEWLGTRKREAGWGGLGAGPF